MSERYVTPSLQRRMWMVSISLILANFVWTRDPWCLPPPLLSGRSSKELVKHRNLPLIRPPIEYNFSISVFVFCVERCGKEYCTVYETPFKSSEVECLEVKFHSCFFRKPQICTNIKAVISSISATEAIVLFFHVWPTRWSLIIIYFHPRSRGKMLSSFLAKPIYSCIFGTREL